MYFYNRGSTNWLTERTRHDSQLCVHTDAFNLKTGLTTTNIRNDSRVIQKFQTSDNNID